VGGVALAKVVTRQEYDETAGIRREHGADLAAATHRAEEYTNHFLQAVAALPSDAELEGHALWEQLAVCQRALAAYCEWSMRNIGTAVYVHSYHEELKASLDALVSRVMAALQDAPFAGMDEERVGRLLGGVGDE
jgi:hypothetical protein